MSAPNPKQDGTMPTQENNALADLLAASSRQDDMKVAGLFDIKKPNIMGDRVSTVGIRG